ncbi:MAG: GAF domain-containing protein [Vampirovibrionales bacterium]
MKRTTKPSPTDDQGIKSSKAAKGTTSSAKQREASLSKASNTYVASSKTAHAVDPVLESIQAAGADTADIRVQDLILSELNAARLLNVELTDDPAQFIHLLENRVKEITATRNNVILILDEESGTYRCLNDEQHSHIAVAPRELTWISDTYLQELLGSEQVIHSFLHYKGAVFGIIAVADKLDGTHFNLRDELILEQLSQYLSVQVNHYMAIKKASILPAMQQILLRISSRLLSAVDSPAIFQATLASLVEELPFNAGQYITLDRQTGDGYVVYQMSDDGFAQGMPLFTVDSFSSMMSLFQSQVWSHQYLYLRGETLGDKQFADIFGMPDIQSVLVLPLLGADGQVSGALVLFQQGAQTPLSKEALSVLEQASELIVAACARAQVLEKALEIATTDELTETLNRRGFYSRFQAEVRSRRTSLRLV